MSQARMPRTPANGARGAVDSGPIPFRRKLSGPPPLNPQAERAALGALILHPQALFDYADLIDAEDWYEPKNAAVYAAMVALLSAGKVEPDTVLDPVTLHDEMRRAQTYHLLEPTYLSSCVQECGRFEHARKYLRIVLETATRRREAFIGNALAENYITSAHARAQLAALAQRMEEFDSGEPSRRLGIMLSEVETRPIRWLWHGRLAFGKVTLVDGDAGDGKGLMTLDLAARLTRGWPMPGELDRREPANVVLMTPEDDAADTIKPRLEAMGADVSRVRVLNTIDEMDSQGRTTPRALTFPRDAALVEREMRGDGACYLLIDPIMGCLDQGVKTGIDSEVRAALMPLKDMVERNGYACVLVRHFNKSGGDNAQYRGGGSVAFGALARMHYILAPHPDNEEMRILAPVKVNIAKKPQAIAFRIIAPDGPDGWPRITWDNAAPEYTANELLGNVKITNERRQIVRVLQAAGRDMQPSDVAEELGIADDDKAAQANLRKALSRMAAAGQVRKGVKYGTYTAISSPTLSPTTTQSQLS